MAFNTIVCIKQVPDPEHFDKIRLDPRTGAITRDGVPEVINPLDRHAIEESLRIRERFPGRVVGISMGPPQAQKALEEALATGIDEAVLLCDPAFARADSLATARCLALAIGKLEPYSLILCGNETVDGGTAQVAPQIAEFLDLPHVTAVQSIESISEDKLLVRCALERGYMRVEVTLPAVVAVTRGINQPRLPTVMGIMEAAQKPFHTWRASDLAADAGCFGWQGSPSKVAGSVQSRLQRRGEILRGKPEEVAREALRRLREMEAL